MAELSREQFDEMLANMTSSDKAEVVRNYCEENGYEQPIPMDELDELHSDKTISEFLPRWFYGYRYNSQNSEAREENNPNDDYFIYNGYGNIQTMPDYEFDNWVNDKIEEIWCNNAVEEYFADYLPEEEEDEDEE